MNETTAIAINTTHRQSNAHVRENVREILNQLVTHFRQEIHARVLDESHSSSEGIVRVVSEDNAQGKDRQRQRQQQNPAQDKPLSPVVRFWLDRLLSLASISSDSERGKTETETETIRESAAAPGGGDDARIDAVAEWIRGYENAVRPLLFRSAPGGSAPALEFDPGGLSVLTSYERILSGMLAPRTAAAPDSPGESCPSTIRASPASSLVVAAAAAANGGSSDARPGPREALQRTVGILFTDVTLLTARTRTSNGTETNRCHRDEINRLRTGVALPTLLRVLGSVLETLRVWTVARREAPCEIRGSGSGSDSDSGGDRSWQECCGCLRRCSLTLLAFELPSAVVRDGDGDDDDDDDDDDGDEASVRLASAVLSPHHVSPSLAAGRCQSTDLRILQKLRRQLEGDCLRNPEHIEESKTRASSESRVRVLNCIDRAVRIHHSCAYNDLDDDYWNSLPSNPKGSFFSTHEWFDPRSEGGKETSRIVRGTWRKMKDLLLSSLSVGGELRETNREKSDATIPGTRNRDTDFVLQTLGGAGPLLRDARAHFFGRDMHGTEALLDQLRDKESSRGDDGFVAESVVLRMGRRVVGAKPKRKGGDDDAPHAILPSRVAATMNAVRWLLVPGMIGDNSQSARIKAMLEDIFPICATLVDSTSSSLVALGAAGFLRATDALQAPTSVVPDSSADVATTGDEMILPFGDSTAEETEAEMENAWNSFSENALSVLDRAFRVSSDPGALLAIGGAQTKLLGWMVLRETERNRKLKPHARSPEDKNRFRRKRRTVTGQWLTNLEQSLYRSTTKRQSLELLLGGVIPLLSQHATEDDRNGADGMEVGRLGLAALLPLTTNSTATSAIPTDGAGQSDGGDFGTKTQVASIVALINLMFAAHPVMPGHGGKILTHLLAAAAAASSAAAEPNRYPDKNEILTGNKPAMSPVREVAILAAALALVICGPRFTVEILESIEKDCDRYQQELVTVAFEVRELAQGLRQHS